MNQSAKNIEPANHALDPNIASFSNAVFHAKQALLWRGRKRRDSRVSPGLCEAIARQHEVQVREYALRAEIALQRAADALITQTKVGAVRSAIGEIE